MYYNLFQYFFRMEVTDPNTNFPISVKTKVQLIVSDNITPAIIKSEKIGLRKLDGTEQNEKHVVQAVSSETIKVPIPKFDKIQKPPEGQSSVYFSSPSRCFIYDSSFLEPMVYYCDMQDQELIHLFNLTHKFLKMTTKQVEQVILALEMIVKDFLTENPPIDQVLYLLDDQAPPYPIVKAIYDHWRQRARLNGSLLRYLEFPPDHCGIRASHIKMITQKNKNRKNMADLTYIRRLHSELNEIREKREEAVKLLELEKYKRKKNIVFIREIMRKVPDNACTNYSLMLKPKLEDADSNPQPEPEELKHSPLPGPPTVPVFLSWCQDQN